LTSVKATEPAGGHKNAHSRTTLAQENVTS
jgi:hypothetical protein